MPVAPPPGVASTARKTGQTLAGMSAGQLDHIDIILRAKPQLGSPTYESRGSDRLATIHLNANMGPALSRPMARSTLPLDNRAISASFRNLKGARDPAPIPGSEAPRRRL